MSLASRFGDGVGQRAKLAFAGAGAYDEVIGEDGLAAEIEEDDVFGLFIFEGGDEAAGKIKRFQRLSPCGLGQRCGGRSRPRPWAGGRWT